MHGIFLFQNSLFDFVKCARRNSRKRRGCAGLPCGISISHRLHRLHGFSHLIFRYAQDFVLLRYKNLTYNKIRYLTASNALYGFAQILSLCDGFLDGLEELGRCAALDFVILVFRQDMVAFGILICKDNNFF